MKQLFTVGLLAVGLLAVAFCSAVSHAQDRSQVNKLADIRKIYIGDLGREEGSDLVREKIRVRLMKSERFSVVERPEAADAVLTGVAGVVRSYNNAVHTDQDGNVHGSGSTSFSGTGVLRLVDTKTDETIWVFEYKRGFAFKGASNRVADKTVEKLLKDATPQSSKKSQ